MTIKLLLIWLAIFVQISLQWESHPTWIPTTYGPHLPTSSPSDGSDLYRKHSSSKIWDKLSSSSQKLQSTTPCETTSSLESFSSPFSYVTTSSLKPSSSPPCEETSISHSAFSYSHVSTSLISPSYDIPPSSSSPSPYSSPNPGCPTVSITEYRTVYITTQVRETDTITTTHSGVCLSSPSIITDYETVSITRTLPGRVSTTTKIQTSVVVSTLTTFACQARTTYVTNYNYGKFEPFILRRSRISHPI